jgi:hypothetical protein
MLMMRSFSKNASTLIREPSLIGLSLIALAVMTTLASSGCSSIILKAKGPLDNIDPKGLQQAGYTMGQYGTERAIPAGDSSSPSVVLEVHNGKRHFEKIPLVAGQPLFISDLIRDAKLQKKIGKIKTTILRPNGKNLPPVRLDVDFDDSGKSVMEGQNYSLRAGDHIVVRQDDRSVLTGMMPSMPFMKR